MLNLGFCSSVEKYFGAFSRGAEISQQFSLGDKTIFAYRGVYLIIWILRYICFIRMNGKCGKQYNSHKLWLIITDKNRFNENGEILPLIKT